MRRLIVPEDLEKYDQCRDSTAGGRLIITGLRQGS